MNYEIRNNEQFGSVEVFFHEIPDAATREALKANAFRWHAAKKCWYGYKTAEEVAEILKGGKAATEPKAPKQAKKYSPTLADRETLKAEYIKIWGDDSDMVKYSVNHVNKLIKLSDGLLLTFGKKRLETRFCYGYGMYACSTEEDEKNAYDSAKTMLNDGGDEFIKENLAGLNESIQELNNIIAYKINHQKWLDKLEDLKTIENEEERQQAINAWYSDYYKNEWHDAAGLKVIFINSYCSSCEDSKIADYSIMNLTRYQKDTEWYKAHGVKYRDATDDEIKAIIEVLEEMKAEQLKRCQTYLKKYGTSKLNVWTYLRD